MKFNRKISYVFLLIGAAAVIFTLSTSETYPYIQIIGFGLLMMGLFGVYSSIKTPKPNMDPYAVQNEEEE